MGRVLAPVVAGFAAGVLVGLFVATTCSPPALVVLPDEHPGAARDETHDAARGPREARTRARQPAADAASGGASDASADSAPAIVIPPRAAGDPDVREIALPGAPTGWADLEVQLLDADGAPLENQDFTVLREGASLSREDDTDIPPHGSTGMGGLATIRVAAPGRHTVRVDRGSHRLERSASVPGAARVVLREPAWRAIRFFLAPDAPTDAPTDVQIRPWAHPVEGPVVTADGTTIVPVPEGAPQAELTAATPEALLYVADALRWRFDSGTPAWRCIPSEGTAPCAVEVRPAEWTPLTVSVHLRSSDPMLDAERAIDAAWDAGAGPVEAKIWIAARGEPDETWDGVQVPVGGPRGVLRWSGPEIASGETAYDVGEAASIQVEVLHLPSTPPEQRSARVRVPEGGSLAKLTALRGVLFDPSGPYDSIGVELVAGDECRLPAEGRWFVATRLADDGDADRDVAGPVRLVSGRRTDVPLVRGGWLVVVPRSLPARRSGRLEIMRADGAPLLRPDGDGEPQVGLRADAPGGTILGPFAPGPVVLDVLVGRVRWQRLEAVVREGEHVALPVGPFGAETRR